MKKIKVEIEGTAPLLMHRFVPDNGSRKKKQVYVPEDEAEVSAYRNEDGELILPSAHFKASMVKASTDFMYKGKKTYKEYIKAGIFIDETEIKLDQQEYIIHTEPVVINRSRVLSWRPRFNEWSCGFTMNVLNEDLDKTTLREILDNAGKYKGVGDHRPDYGRFEVTEFKEIKP